MASIYFVVLWFTGGKISIIGFIFVVMNCSMTDAFQMKGPPFIRTQLSCRMIGTLNGQDVTVKEKVKFSFICHTPILKLSSLHRY